MPGGGAWVCGGPGGPLPFCPRLGPGGGGPAPGGPPGPGGGGGGRIKAPVGSICMYAPSIS